MEKDKIIKTLNLLEKNIKLIIDFVVNFAEKIIEKFDNMSPSENIKKRIISALILIPIAIYAICFAQNLFIFLAIVLTILMTVEWLEITKSATEKNKWQLIGLLYIAFPIFCVIKLRIMSSNIVLWMFFVIWATDIFAFFSGKTFGGKKLAPKISPNKTWSGLAGGVGASMFIGLLSSVMFPGGTFFFIFMSAILALIEQAGDLFESKIKRIFGVKDSSNIIPGHGGILDRLDGLMFTAPVVLFIVTIFSNKFFNI